MHTPNLPFIDKQDIKRDFPNNFLRAGQSLDDLVARNVVEVNMTWRMKGADEPPYSPRTVLRNIRLRNIRAHAERGGIIQGFEEQPIPRGAISFENCLFDTGAPLQISHADVDLSGVVMDKF